MACKQPPSSAVTPKTAPTTPAMSSAESPATWGAWGNAAEQDVSTSEVPGPWAPDVLERAAAAGDPDPCGTPGPFGWAAPLDDGGAGSVSTGEASIYNGDSGSGPAAALRAPSAPAAERRDPLTHARNPIAAAGDPSKTSKQAARFKQDIIDNSERKGQSVDTASVTLGHDRAELRMGYEDPSKGGKSSGEERVFRASGGDIAVGQAITSTHADKSKQSSQMMAGTDGISWAGSQEIRTADGRKQTMDAGLTVGQGAIKGNVKVGTSGPGHSGSLGDPGRATRMTGPDKRRMAPDLAREVRDPRNSLDVSTSASASMNGSVKVTAKLAGQSSAGDWLVAYSVPVDHRVAVEIATKIDRIDHLAAKGPAKAGSPVSISTSIGRSGKVELSGTRAFATKKQAEDWAASPQYLDLVEVPVGADNVAALRVGERRRIAASIGLDVGVSASGGALAANVGASADGGVALDVQRDDERWTSVTLDGHISGQAAASLGAPLLTVGGQTHAAELRRLTYRFDLSDEAAQRAYDALLLGTLPTPSASVVGPLDVKQSVQGEAASATTPFGTVRSGGQAKTTDITRPDGSRTIVDEGAQVQGFSGSSWLSWLGWGGNDTSNERGLGARTDLDTTGSEAGSRVKAIASAEGSDAGRMWDELALFDMRGAPRNTGEGRASGGEWRLTLLWGDGSLDALVAKVKEDPQDFVRASPSAYQSFHSAILAAGDDREAQREALRAYGKSGLPARANLQRLLGTAGRETHLEREGCEVWIGVEGWLREEAALRALNGAVAISKDESTRKARQALLRHHDRLDALEDWSRFPEVPTPVREEEIARTLRFIARTERVLAQANPEASQASSSSDETSGANNIEGSASIDQERRPAGGLSQPAGDALTEAQSAALESKRRADRAYGSVRELEKRHMIGIEYNHASRWWRLAKTSYFGFVVDGPEAESYRKAERFKGEGEQARREGAGAAHHARHAEVRDELPIAVQMFGSATQKFKSANNHFAEARNRLLDIEQRDRK